MKPKAFKWCNPRTWSAEGRRSGIATLISIIAAGVCVAHWKLPTTVTLDAPTVGILFLAALPWLARFVKSLKVPGVGEAELQDRTQGETDKPVAPANLTGMAGPVQQSTLPPETRKLLATLWRYQRQSFGDDISKRWTFLILPQSPQYLEFVLGLADAVQRGWVTIAPDTHQVMLTNEGLAFVEGHPEVQQHQPVYQF